MTKKVSIVVICVLCALTLFFCVCSCLPGGLEYGDYNIYNSAINLIQGDGLFTDSVVTTYKVKLDDGVAAKSVVSSIRSRLGNMYGRWFCSVTENDGIITVKVPKTANEDKTTATAMLTRATANGKVEVITSQTYAEADVLLTSEHVKGTSVRHFASGSNAYYIVNVTLTAEGKAIAAEKLEESSSAWSAYLAIDESVTNGIAYNSRNGKLQIYASSDEDANIIVGFLKSGALGAKLTSVTTDDAPNNGGLVYAIICGVLVLGSWIFYLVRYKKSAIGVILAQFIAITVFIMFAGYVYFAYLNIASAIFIILGYGLMSCFSCLVLGKINSYYLVEGKTYASSRYKAFADNNKWNLIVHAAVLVAGIVLWLIPTGITAPIGNTLVYWAVLSFAVTMGLNRLFTSLASPLVDSVKHSK